jgi:putative RecB family exonuclease
MSWQNFQNLQIPLSSTTHVKRRYSVTSDVLSYQRCARQYGYFAVRGYEPSQSVQIYYGTLIHQVLDRAHAHYRGSIDPTTQGQIPTDQDIERYFNEVDSSLRARGISSVSGFRQAREREAALRRIQLFNQIEGSQLYPRIRDTEHRLQSDRGNYLLHGTVDVLADDPNWLPTMGAEIWDYKGGHRPNLNSEDYRRYEFQMLVYAELYRERNGLYPVKAILYFLGELDAAQTSLLRPSTALVEVPLQPARIQVALQTFGNTVTQIENSRATDTWTAPLPGQEPDQKTCDICDLRWNCPTVQSQYPMRYP